MKNFHALSFILGLASGCLVLVLLFGAVRLVRGPVRTAGMGAGNFQQGQGGAGRMNPAVMAERLGMTEAELQAELDSGKTMQQIAAEKGIDMPMGGMRNRNPMQGSVSGSTLSSSSSSSSPVSSSSSR